MITTVNKNMISGDHKTMPFNAVDNVGAAVTVTGGTATYKIASSPYSTALLTLTSATAAITLSGTVVTISLVPDDTEDLDGIYYHELQVVDAASKTLTGFTGTIVIKGDLI